MAYLTIDPGRGRVSDLFGDMSDQDLAGLGVFAGLGDNGNDAADYMGAAAQNFVPNNGIAPPSASSMPSAGQLLSTLSNAAKTGADVYTTIQKARAVTKPPQAPSAPPGAMNFGKGTPAWITYGVVGLAGLAVLVIAMRLASPKS